MSPKKKRNRSPKKKRNKMNLEGNSNTETMKEYIQRIKISDDDPGVLLNWDLLVLETFVQNANQLYGQLQLSGLANAPAQPYWISTYGGQMKSSTFQQDVIKYLASTGGGSYGRVLIAPNSLVQFGQVLFLLRNIEYDGFIQAAMIGIPAKSFLASIAILHEKNNISGTPFAPTGIPPDPPFRQVFN